MKLKASHIFTILVIGLAASVYIFEYKGGQEKEKKKEEASVIFPVKNEEIAKVQLKKGDSEVELAKDGKTWKIIKPLSDLGDVNEISDWLRNLLSQKSKETLGEGKSIDWKVYGLDVPKATLTLTTIKSETLVAELSTRNNFEGNPYLRKNQGSVVLVVDPNWMGMMDKTARDLRDKRIVRHELKSLDQVKIRNPKGEIELKMVEGQWVAPQQSSWRLSQAQARDLVSALSDMRATEFASETEPTTKEKANWGLAKPLVTVEVKFTDGAMYLVSLGQSKDKAWYGFTNEFNKTLKMSGTLPEKLQKATLVGLRDSEAPFVFASGEVKKINLERPKNLTLSKEGESWVTPDKMNIDSEQVSLMLTKMSQLRVVEFFDSKKQVDPKNQTQKVELLDEGGNSVFSLILGEAYKKKIDGVQKELRYAKTSAFPGVISVEESVVSTIPFGKLIKTEPTKEETPVGAKPEEKHAP